MEHEARGLLSRPRDRRWPERERPRHRGGRRASRRASASRRHLHSYGKSFATRWVTLHDTAVDGTAAFNANALAKARLATPFKRPENGQFQPGTGFRRFFFDETGDTNALTEAGAGFGGFGGVFVLTQSSPSADSGALALFYRGDSDHTGFDNVAFKITGIVVSNGDPGATGLLGAQLPQPFHDGWRVFYTQQHGDNTTWEILPRRSR